MRLRAISLAFALLATAASAQDFVKTKGQLSDEDFHRLVACGAQPGKDCRIPMRYWPSNTAQAITVTRLPDIDPVLPAVSAQIDAALDNAIAEINGVGAAIHLLRLPDNMPARIRLSVRSPQALRLLSHETDPRMMPAGMVLFDPGLPERITGASIVISSRILLGETKSVVLEEVMQSLGLPFDISNDYYQRRSIFSQEANAVTRLTGQDARALSLHYPPTP
ncbi:MAG: hypothetical protein DI533_06850 [Cereibacter sphaeroides]|uniref:DUF2927 domain-containing protein n=1 Tax=Cereibacter sphaeroides TaxID=1063 RepID=A0A2W5SKZ7_CERSP|nr:MAG: hypothetical protein DI533_06850 [Cereibacter sphaeroides]